MIVTSMTTISNSSGDLAVSHLSDGDDLPLEEGIADMYDYYGKSLSITMSRSGKVYVDVKAT